MMALAAEPASSVGRQLSGRSARQPAARPPASNTKKQQPKGMSRADPASAGDRNRNLNLDASPPMRPDLPCEPQLSAREPRNLPLDRTVLAGDDGAKRLRTRGRRNPCAACRSRASPECGAERLTGRSAGAFLIRSRMRA